MSNIRQYKNFIPDIHSSAYVDEAAVVIGDVKIGEASSVWPCVVIRGDIHKIRIGHHTNIQDGSVLHVTHASEFTPEGYPLIIGNHVIVGHNVTLHGCTVHDHALIGMNAVVLDGAIVESDVYVAAGSVVGPGKVLESGYLYRGNPIRQARELAEKEREFLHYSPMHYAELGASFKQEYQD